MHENIFFYFVFHGFWQAECWSGFRFKPIFANLSWNSLKIAQKIIINNRPSAFTNPLSKALGPQRDPDSLLGLIKVFNIIFQLFSLP